MTSKTDDTRRGARSGLRLVAPIAAWILLAIVAADRPARADDAEQPRPDASVAPPATDSAQRAAPSDAATSAAAPSPPILYVPPSRGAVRHTAGAGTRSLPPRSSAGNSAPNAPFAPRARVRVLAPRDHVGLTGRASPTLYWHLSADTTTKIELTVVDDDAIEPVVRLSLPGPVSAGLHALDLASLGVELAPEKTYRWFVALVHDPHRRSKDELAEGAILRKESPAPANVPSALGSPREEALRAAGEGHFYDALAALSSAIDAAPADAAVLRADRAALLVQASVDVTLD
jgi:Domain of Unknown Function (DUF928)